jgi:hypothetical protein
LSRGGEVPNGALVGVGHGGIRYLECGFRGYQARVRVVCAGRFRQIALDRG